MSVRFGYGLNGFTDHRLSDALAVLADLGYDGGGAHPRPRPPRPLRARTSPPAPPTWPLCSPVMTSGSWSRPARRYVLDPRRKHEPTLVSDVGRDRRIDLSAQGDPCCR